MEYTDELRALKSFREALARTKEVDLWSHPKVTYARDMTIRSLDDVLEEYDEKVTEHKQDRARKDANGDTIYIAPVDEGQGGRGSNVTMRRVVVGNQVLESPAEEEGEEQITLVGPERTSLLLQNGALTYDIPKEKEGEIDELEDLHEEEKTVDVHTVSKALALNEEYLDATVLNRVDFGAIDPMLRDDSPTLERLVTMLDDAGRSVMTDVIDYAEDLLTDEDDEDEVSEDG